MGCAVYFTLRGEPDLWPLVLAGGATAGLWLVARSMGLSRGWTLPLLMLASFCCGLMVAKLRTEAVRGPIAPAMAAPTVVEAWVMDVDSPGQRGHRIVVAPVRIRGLEPEQTPDRLRVTLQGAPPKPGEAVRLYGILNPPPSPASPGAYDFGRNAYFQGMGGTLFGLGSVRRAALEPPPWRIAVMMKVNAVRFALAERIVARQGERLGGIAAAMTTGHETWIQEDDLQAMRDSGLAHILSISGLHMAIVGGFVFFGVRLAVAALPWLALRVSGKKVAAMAALTAVGVYLVISGAPPPAERAAITASIAFAAILLNRQAVTMHGLAVAAMLVLAMQPEAIVTPGFQMSFAATSALVALVEVWPRRFKEISVPWPILAVQRLGTWLAAACAASLVAGMATGPFAMQHFNRTALYGLLANMGTAPVADFLIMPMLALGAVLEPVGLGGPFLWLASKGVEAMLAIGHWAASLPGAVQTVATAPAFTLPMAFIGILFICLWRGWGRWLGLPLAMAVLFWPREQTPDLWIGDSGTQAAWVIGDHAPDQAMVMRGRVRQFAVDMWTQRRGLEPVSRPKEGWTCRRTSCFAAEDVQPVALWWGRAVPNAERMEEMCLGAEVVAVRAEVPRLPSACDGRLVLDGRDFAMGGSVELWRSPGGWKAQWAADLRGRRPWSQLGDPDFSDSGG